MTASGPPLPGAARLARGAARPPPRGATRRHRVASRRARIPRGRGGCATLVTDRLHAAAERALHWNTTYRDGRADELSWHQAEPGVSFELVDALEVPRETPVIDVGGGTSTFVDGLLERGFGDVTVLDVAVASLEQGRHRVGTQVAWLHEDVLTWRPTRRYGLWHDRAMLHFLVDADARATYLRALETAVPGGFVVIGTFSPAAPDHCSGLPVVRYSATDLVRLLGTSADVLETREETHHTPRGTPQPFTWVAGRLEARRGASATTPGRAPGRSRRHPRRSRSASHRRRPAPPARRPLPTGSSAWSSSCSWPDGQPGAPVLRAA